MLTEIIGSLRIAALTGPKTLRWMSRASARRSTERSFTSQSTRTLMATFTSSSATSRAARRPCKVSTDAALTIARSVPLTSSPRSTTPSTLQQRSLIEHGTIGNHTVRHFPFPLFSFVMNLPAAGLRQFWGVSRSVGSWEREGWTVGWLSGFSVGSRLVLPVASKRVLEIVGLWR
jgi:hypothetical protein